MKKLLFALLYSSSLFAHYSKPELMARYASIDSWNAPVGMACFTSEPLVAKDSVLLSCEDAQGTMMVEWKNGWKIIARASEEAMFSLPEFTQDIINWHEFNEAGVTRLFSLGSHGLKVKELADEGYGADSFVLLREDVWSFRKKEEGTELWTWDDKKMSRDFPHEAAYVFSPIVSHQGNIVMKVREKTLDESAPDRLWIKKEDWKIMLQDRDADPSSRWISFRHQMAFDQDQIFFIAKDERGEVIMLDSQEVARAGRELGSFDYFSPKLRNGVAVFRGIDLQGKKSFWVFAHQKLTKLITQGDVVSTDRGLARVDYENPDALFYGASGIGSDGDIYLQATLTDLEHPDTVLGIGLLKFSRLD